MFGIVTATRGFTDQANHLMRIFGVSFSLWYALKNRNKKSKFKKKKIEIKSKKEIETL